MRFDYFVYSICITILIIRLMKCHDMILKFFFFFSLLFSLSKPLSYSLTSHHFGNLSGNLGLCNLLKSISSRSSRLSSGKKKARVSSFLLSCLSDISLDDDVSLPPSHAVLVGQEQRLMLSSFSNRSRPLSYASSFSRTTLVTCIGIESKTDKLPLNRLIS
ncbi:hypothetical protein EDC96DRAFT_519656 [Choanephora cucurbitarum]|nr:hypothetical protein EDC96DRAFT_519656 [Choanephora cucurbitarum]